jgi:DNA-binding transcriptional LysR family regulator
MTIDPRHFRILLAVIEHGSFNRAATALSLSQPAISKAIAQLERSLGARLFERGKQGTRPTSAGLLAARGATNIDWAIRHARAEIRANAENLVGPLVIGTTPSMILGLLPRALSLLAKTYPDASVVINDGLDDLLLAELDRGEIELLVGPVESVRPCGDRIVQVTLAQEPFLLGVPHDHRLSARKELAIAELSDEAWILPIEGSSFYRLVEALFLTSSQRLPLNAIHSNSFAMQEQLVTGTGRICFVTPAQFLYRAAPFKIIRLVNPPVRSIGVRYRADVTLSPIAEQLIASLRELTQDIEREFRAISGIGGA